MYKLFVGIAFILLMQTNVFSQDDLVDLQGLSEKLNEKQQQLDKREAMLNEREKQLNELEEMLNNKQKELEKLRQDLTVLYEKIRKTEDENIKQLAKIYSSTRPQAAAQIINKMEISKATSIFQEMNPLFAGKILTALGQLNPEFASQISERLSPNKNILGGENAE